MYAHASSEYIQTTAGAVLAALQAAFSGGAEAMLEEAVAALVPLHVACGTWQRIVDWSSGEEQTYFYDGGDDWWDYRQRRLQGDEYFYESRLRGAQLLDPWRR